MLTLLTGLFLVVSGAAYSQSKQLASSEEEYHKMFHDQSINMVRSHNDFVDYLKEHSKLRSYFGNLTTVKSFLMDLKFCKDELITFRMRSLKFKSSRDEAQCYNMIATSLGFEASFLGKKYKGDYCNPPAPCDPYEGETCYSRNCGSRVIDPGSVEYRILSPTDF